ncbi:hypothetical protein B0H14DRAFT_2620365 [Mycena olivaceomarginata]|nr:hypothetical protein B0H14DRAFT_2620365 [Mycena olivaceomarginata]
MVVVGSAERRAGLEVWDASRIGQEWPVFDALHVITCSAPATSVSSSPSPKHTPLCETERLKAHPSVPQTPWDPSKNNSGKPKEQMYTSGFRLQDIPTVFLTSSRPTVGSCASHYAVKAFALHRTKVRGSGQQVRLSLLRKHVRKWTFSSVWDGNFGCLLLAAHTLTPSTPTLCQISVRGGLQFEPHAAERAHADPADAITLPN